MTSIITTANVIVAATSTAMTTATMMVVVPVPILLPTECMTSISTVTHGVLPVGISVVVVAEVSEKCGFETIAEVAKIMQ